MGEFKEYDILNNVNQWIFNCDTKTSIILATFGVFFSAFFSSDIFTHVTNIIRTNINVITLCSVLYLLILAISVAFILFGTYKLLIVLIPRIHLTHSSVMFFGKVSSYPTFDDYKKSVEDSNNKTLSEDLLHQIYEASQICNKKFSNFKTGLVSSLVGFSILMLWLGIGFITYYL